MYEFELMRDARILMNNKKYDLAVKPLLEMQENGLEEDMLETKYLLLSSCYQNLGDHPESLSWADKAVQVNRSSEFASITKCEVYRTMEKYQEAYQEMVSFSDNNKMALY